VDELISYVGLDIPEDMIAVAVAEEGKRGEGREHGKIANGAAGLTKPTSKPSWGGRGFVHEFWPTSADGFWLMLRYVSF
jgi:transposase